MKKILSVLGAVTLIFTMALPTFAASPDDVMDVAFNDDNVYYVASPLPDLPDIPTINNYGAIIYERADDTYICITYNNPDATQKSAKKVILSDGQIEITRNDGTNFDVGLYKLDGDQWVKEHSQTPPKYTLLNVAFVRYTDFNIYDTEDNLLFQQAPQLTHQKLTGMVPSLVIRPMMTTLGILVPCGIGLLALLILLPILKRVLYQFLN